VLPVPSDPEEHKPDTAKDQDAKADANYQKREN
jgi:hypothetical protein